MYPEGIQTDCLPKQWPADSSVTYKGTVMLLHGFTACPQQYFETQAYLTAQGYNVLAPLLPGHGLKFKWIPVYENAGPWWNPWSVKRLSTYKGEVSLTLIPAYHHQFLITRSARHRITLTASPRTTQSSLPSSIALTL